MNIKEILMIMLTLGIALILEVLPFKGWWLWAQPQWVFLVLMFWIVIYPDLVGVGIAWTMGLILDLLKGNLLGENAFVFAIIAYLLIRFHPQLRNFPLWQQTLMIFLLAMLGLALRYWIMGLIGWPPKTWAYWLPALTTALFWPVINFLLRNYSLKFRII